MPEENPSAGEMWRWMQRIEESVAAMRMELASRYVSRELHEEQRQATGFRIGETEKSVVELRNDLKRERETLRKETEIEFQKRDVRAEKLEERAVSTRRWLIGLATTVFISPAVGGIGLLVWGLIKNAPTT